MAFIGPAINLLLALSFYFGSLAILSSSPDKSSSLFIQLCVYGALINTMWFILNILPVSPLPGGQVLQVVLNSPKKGHFISMLFAAIISIAALAFNQLVITLFFGMFAFQNFKAFQHFKRLENEDH